MAKVTVAIPTYNRSSYLKRAIESVLIQTYHDIEILIVDNASSDETYQVVHAFSDPRIHYLRNDVNIGIVGNWNRCLEFASRSEYVMFFSDDDIMKDTLVDRYAQILDMHSEVVAVQSDFAGINQEGDLIADKISAISEDQFFKPLEFIENSLTNHYVFGVFALMLKTKAIEGTNLKFNERAKGWSHILLCLAMNIRYSVYFIAEPLAYYRYHGTGASGQDSRSPAVYDDVVSYYEEVISFLTEHQLNAFIDKARHGLMNYELLRFIYQSGDKLLFNINLLSPELQDFICSTGFWKMDSTNALKNQIFLMLNGLPQVVPTLDSGESPRDPTKTFSYYKKWTLALREGKGMSFFLRDQGVRRVAVFGTRITAYYSILDLMENGIVVDALIDNNGNMQGRHIHGVGVFGTEWLVTHYTDAIIVTIEGEHREGIKKILKAQVAGRNTQVYTWQELLDYSD